MTTARQCQTAALPVLCGGHHGRPFFIVIGGSRSVLSDAEHDEVLY